MKRQFKHRITLLDCEYWNKFTRLVFILHIYNNIYIIIMQTKIVDKTKIYVLFLI